jgi:hypothetical protein
MKAISAEKDERTKEHRSSIRCRSRGFASHQIRPVAIPRHRRICTTQFVEVKTVRSRTVAQASSDHIWRGVYDHSRSTWP